MKVMRYFTLFHDDNSASDKVYYHETLFLTHSSPTGRYGRSSYREHSTFGTSLVLSSHVFFSRLEQ